MKFEEISQTLREAGVSVCPICGMPYKPYRKTQLTCGEKECRRVMNSRQTAERARRRLAENPEEERKKRAEAAKKYRHKQKTSRMFEEQLERIKELTEHWEEKEDAIVGEDYGKRQMEQTLASLSKIDTSMNREQNK